MTVAIGTGAPHGRTRRFWILGAKLAVSLGLLFWLARGLGLRTIANAMASASPLRLLLAVLLLAISHVLASWQWGRLLGRAGVRVPPRRVLGYTWAAALGNLVLPTGAGGTCRPSGSRHASQMPHAAWSSVPVKCAHKSCCRH